MELHKLNSKLHNRGGGGTYSYSCVPTIKTIDSKVVNYACRTKILYYRKLTMHFNNPDFNIRFFLINVNYVIVNFKYVIFTYRSLKRP